MTQSDAPAGAANVTLLLARWQEGDAEAFERAAGVVFPELRRIAEAYLRRDRRGHTLQPTALIHELFLRLTNAGSLQFESRKHFYALSAQLMRRILVDHARGGACNRATVIPARILSFRASGASGAMTRLLFVPVPQPEHAREYTATARRGRAAALCGGSIFSISASGLLPVD
jgi:DNA-directed RNA polymerase specialized sigma24 family protein